jgi:dephospho-CoA kinase
VSILTVALTGGIATGKSVIAKALADHACYVQSADRVAHDLMKPGRPAWKRILSHFGAGILNADRTVNRRLLGKIVFSNEAERQYLNRLLHPLVLLQKKQTVRKLERSGTHRIFVSEAALTIESGFASYFDKIVVVHCTERVQMERLMKRDAITRSEARKKIRSQMPAAEKIKQAHYLIDTSGSPAETLDQAEHLYRSLLSDFRKKEAREKRGRASGRSRGRQPKEGPRSRGAR